MSDKPEIEKLRVLHDLQVQFDVPDAMRTTLESQLSDDDQSRIARFVSGFRIEDWFEWIFSAMPWVKLIHALDQQQFPSRSKSEYQVPDFLVLVEATDFGHKPLLVDVKRVPQDKRKLKLQGAQCDLSERYAATLNAPLVHAVYWEFLSGWTMNTPDTFETKSSSRKLSIEKAFEFDCSAILGDISHIVPESLKRALRFSQQDTACAAVFHEQHGRLVSDTATLGERQVVMTGIESAALDSMLAMKETGLSVLGESEVELTETLASVYVLKLSSWITRHLSLLNTEPSEELSNVSAQVIVDLMKKLGCPTLHLFPRERTEQMKRLVSLFMS
jgi:hypothetical protein